MYGLFKRTYFHYRWDDLIAVAPTRKLLKDLYKQMKREDDEKYPHMVFAPLEPNTKEIFLNTNQIEHYTIVRVKYLT